LRFVSGIIRLYCRFSIEIFVEATAGLQTNDETSETTVQNLINLLHQFIVPFGVNPVTLI